MAAFGIGTVELGGSATPVAVDERGVTPLYALLAAPAPATVRGLLDGWDGWCDAIAAALAASDGSATLAPGEARFLAPIPDAGSVYCAGANYRDHVEEMGVELPDKATSAPFHFMLPAASLNGHGGRVPRPPGCEQLDWEAELAVVIGRRAEGVSAATALDHVAGYANANDISLRDGDLMRHPIFGMNWSVAKGQRGMTPIGPAIVPARFVADPMALAVTLTVNGDLKQRSSTREMVYDVSEQIAALSARVALLPGDVLLTGTPAGTGAAHGHYLADGDRVRVAIEGLGELVNDIAGT